MDFQTFNFHPLVAAGIKTAGYDTPTPIQEKAIPLVMQGRDIMGLAQTGTGKTAAFVLPILHRLLAGKRRVVRALIVAPTRELAEQIHTTIGVMGRKTGLRNITVYGGVSINPQKEKIKRGAEIVVACPGRLLDHLSQATIDLSPVEVLVLDEADQMFDMGFLPDIRRILKHLPAKRQTMLFSATMPPEIRRLAREVLTEPVTVQVGTTAPANTVSHALYPVAPHLKTPLLLELLNKTATESVLVFTRTKHRAKRLAEQMVKAGHRAASLQGNLSQARRQEAMGGFRDGTFQILVATDIAARGIDVTQISHVINYDIPNTTDAYIHRIGRTGRAARNGDAYTLVTGEDTAMVRDIERILGSAIKRRTVEGFDYSVAAPRKNTGEFDRPPLPPRTARFPKPRATAASHRRATSSPRPDAVRTGTGRPPAETGSPAPRRKTSAFKPRRDR